MPFNRKFVNIIGAGFAGIECALFLATHGVKVHIFDSGRVFEKDVFDENASLVKEKTKKLLTKELERLGSPLVCYGEKQGLSEKEILQLGKTLINQHPNIKVINACVHELNPGEVTVIATGSYTDEGMSDFLVKIFGGMLCHSYMPLYPIFDKSGEKLEERNGNKLLGLSYEEYIKFINGVLDEVRENEVLKEDMLSGTIEKLAFESKNALRDFSLRPVLTSLNDRPYATVKFGQTAKGLLGIGLASTLPQSSQEKIFSKIDFLKDAKLVACGKMLKVCQISSPYVVNLYHQSLAHKNIFFAGSILGISGHIDCIASGLYTALCVLKYVQERAMVDLSPLTAIGKMVKMIATQDRILGGFLEDYQIFSNADLEKDNIVDLFAKRSLDELAKFKKNYNGNYV